MNPKILAILFIAFSYTSNSVTLVNGSKNGTLVIGELNEIHPQVEPKLHRDDDRIKKICSNLTGPSGNRNDEYEIAKFVAKKNIPTICQGEVESDQGITDNNKLTREVQQSNGNYRFRQELSDSEIRMYQERETRKREITRKLAARNKVDRYGPPEDPESVNKEIATQEVKKPDEEVKEQTTASNEETVEKSKTEETDSTKDEEEHVEEQSTTPKSSASENEKVPSDMTKSSNSDEQEDSDESTEKPDSHEGKISPSTTELPHSESSENSDEPTKPSVSTDEDSASSEHETPHLSAPNNFDDIAEIDEENDYDYSEEKVPLPQRGDVNAFINKLDHILETSGDYIIALLLKNYKRRMKTDRVNEKFWDRVREMTPHIDGNVNKAKSLVQSKIRARFGRPFIKEVASTLKSFVDDVGPEFRRAN